MGTGTGMGPEPGRGLGNVSPSPFQNLSRIHFQIPSPARRRYFWGKIVLIEVGGPDPHWVDFKLPSLPPIQILD
ncbi:hypothetical protein CsSME_00023119 [Camellia sinensis var. sinensis]